MKIEESIEIAAPRERVFAVFADIPNAAEYVEAIEQVELLNDKEVGVGFGWRETRTLFGKTATEDMYITEFEPPSSYRVEAASHGAEYVSVFTFEPAGDGTRVTMTFGGKPVSLLAKLMTPIGLLFKGATAKALREDLVQLKAVCERAE